MIVSGCWIISVMCLSQPNRIWHFLCEPHRFYYNNLSGNERIMLSCRLLKAIAATAIPSVLLFVSGNKNRQAGFNGDGLIMLNIRHENDISLILIFLTFAIIQNSKSRFMSIRFYNCHNQLFEYSLN